MIFWMVFSFASVPAADLGHGGSGAVQEEHGGALLSQRSCRHLCVRRDQPPFLWEHPRVDWRVQPALSGAPGASHPGGEQVWPEGASAGAHVSCPVPRWSLRLPPVWDFGQGPCGEGAHRCYLSDFSLQAKESQTSETEATEWEQPQGTTGPTRAGRKVLSMLRSSGWTQSVHRGCRTSVE